jgi:hypothetical protein
MQSSRGCWVREGFQKKFISDGSLEYNLQVVDSAQKQAKACTLNS